jgi:hypothetical protein
VAAPDLNFFHPDRIAIALDAYARRPKSRGWWVSEKARLYALAARAFASGDADTEPLDELYRTLRGYWQIFRNGRGWTARRILRTLQASACEPCGRGRLDLRGLGRHRDLPTVSACLVAMSGVKTLPAGNVSAMAVSKVLHFFNPTLFPIYDRAVVRNIAIPRFRDSIESSCDAWEDQLAAIRSLPAVRRGLRDYVHYLIWSADVVARVPAERSMDVFARRFRAMVAEEDRGETVPPHLDRYYACAFEMAMVGALDVPAWPD